MELASSCRVLRGSGQASVSRLHRRRFRTNSWGQRLDLALTPPRRPFQLASFAPMCMEQIRKSTTSGIVREEDAAGEGREDG